MTDRMRWLSLAGALAGIAAIIAVILVVVQPPQALDDAGVPDEPVTPQAAPTPDVAAAAARLRLSRIHLWPWQAPRQPRQARQ